jgi:hypothetical protein
MAPVEYFFDDQTAKLEFNVARQFSNIKSIVGNARLMGGIAFRNDELSYPLQAADLIAWERRRAELGLAEDLGGRNTLKRLHTVKLPGLAVDLLAHGPRHRAPPGVRANRPCSRTSHTNAG